MRLHLPERREVASTCLLVLSIAACSDANRLIGRADAEPLPTSPLDEEFSPPTPISELAAPDAEEQDPTLTEDELEIFFASSRRDPLDIWSSTRESVSAAWKEPVLVVELSTEHLDETPEVSANGLTLYLASNRPPAPGGSSGSFHLWLSTRATRSSAWRAPVRVTSPAPETAEISPSLDNSGLWLAYASQQTAGHDLRLARRDSVLGEWTDDDSVDSLNTEFSEWDPALFAKATRLAFASLVSDEGDLVVAKRNSTSESFEAAVPLEELNTSFAEGDPWVSADGRRIYFFSKRSGVTRLYWSQR